MTLAPAAPLYGTRYGGTLR